MNDTHVELARNKSILEYLSLQGVNVQQKGNKHFCSSPFSSDREPSFCVYPNNTFYDFSTGKGGDVINLVKELEQVTFTEAVHHLLQNQVRLLMLNKPKEEPKKPFVLDKYLTTDSDHINLIDKYARSRGITDGYVHGVFFEKEGEVWLSNPALGFVHVDEDLNVCGIKMRLPHNLTKNRFTSRGVLSFYVLENIIEGHFDAPTLYIIESETSANSFWEFCKQKNINCVIISFGAVTAVPERLPNKYKDLKCKLIIDYDGKEEDYLKRLELYSHLNTEPIKLYLNKGEDMNSLYNKGKINLIENLIL